MELLGEERQAGRKSVLREEEGNMRAAHGKEETTLLLEA